MRQDPTTVIPEGLESMREFMAFTEPLRPGIKAVMGHLGLDREAAIALFARQLECALRGDTPEEAQDLFQRLLFAEMQARTPWAVRLAVAGMTKTLPAATKIHDAAVAKGLDPVSALAVKLDISKGQAAEHLKDVRRLKEGKSIEEIVELSIQGNAGKTYEEVIARLA